MFLREQLKAIQKELGEGDAGEEELEELRGRLDALELPAEVRKEVDRELRPPPAAWAARPWSPR